MKYLQLSKLLVLLTIAIASFSCSDKDNDGNSGGERKVKYEVTGNYSGKLMLVTSTNSGNLDNASDLSIPFTKEFSYGSSVMAAGASVQTSGSNVGVPGQSITLKVYLNGKLKETKNQTADGNGLVSIAMAMYTF